MLCAIFVNFLWHCIDCVGN